jgi:hypothetical protein
MSRLRRHRRAIGGRLQAAHRALGPRRTAALVAGMLAAGGGGAVALAGGHSSASQHATQSSAIGTQRSRLPRPDHRAAAKHRRRSATKRVKHAAPTKVASKHAPATSARPSHHSSPASPSRPSPSTHPTTSSPTPAPGRTPSAGPISVTLDVHGGGNASLAACGATQHFRTYPGGSSLSFTGNVRPAPSRQWKVELHFKICQGGVYQDFTAWKTDAHINPRTGAFYGSFGAPPRGLYEIEAVLYLGSTETANESANVNVEIR